MISKQTIPRARQLVTTQDLAVAEIGQIPDNTLGASHAEEYFDRNWGVPGISGRPVRWYSNSVVVQKVSNAFWSFCGSALYPASSRRLGHPRHCDWSPGLQVCELTPGATVVAALLNLLPFGGWAGSGSVFGLWSLLPRK
jgi:hypothetical protein